MKSLAILVRLKLPFIIVFNVIMVLGLVLVADELDSSSFYEWVLFGVGIYMIYFINLPGRVSVELSEDGIRYRSTRLNLLRSPSTWIDPSENQFEWGDVTRVSSVLPRFVPIYLISVNLELERRVFFVGTYYTNSVDALLAVERMAPKATWDSTSRTYLSRRRGDGLGSSTN